MDGLISDTDGEVNRLALLLESLPAVQPRQRLHDRHNFKACEGVIDEFAHSPGIDHALVAQHTQLLRQGWLADTRQRLKLADIALALRQLAEQQQTVFVRQGLEQRARLGCRISQETDFLIG